MLSRTFAACLILGFSVALIDVGNASTPAMPTLDKLAERADLAEKQKEEAKRLLLAQQLARKQEAFEFIRRMRANQLENDKRMLESKQRSDALRLEKRLKLYEIQKQMRKVTDRPPLE